MGESHPYTNHDREPLTTPPSANAATRRRCQSGAATIAFALLACRFEARWPDGIGLRQVEEHWTRSLRFLSTELANAAFTRNGAEVAAMAAGTANTEHQVEQVVLRIHPAPEAPHGATADFDLVHLRQGQETRRERWSITLRFTFLTVIPSELVVYNPMGILITYLQADRALVTEQPR